MMAIRTLASEVRFALRGVRRAPGYAMTVIATLALAIGANLTVFGVMDGLTYRPLRYLRAPYEVHRVYSQWTDDGQRTTSASTQYTRFLDLVREAHALADVAAFAERSLPVGDGDAAQQRPVAVVSASYFRFFEAPPVRGRFYTDAEDAVPRGADVAVLGYAHWQAAFGGRDVVGEVVRIGDMRATIIGVAPEGFDGLNDGRPPVAFVPMTSYAASTGTDDARTYFSAYKWGWVQLLVRRAPDRDLATATADVSRVFRDAWPRVAADNASLPPIEIADPQAVLSAVRAGAGPTAGPEARTTQWLFGLACAVLLIGCANVANLAIARALAHRRDAGVRLALGAGTGRLTLSTCIEATVLATAGGASALIVAHWTRMLVAPVLRPLRVADVPVFDDARLLTVTALAIGFSAAVLGGVPSLLLRRPDQLVLHGRSRGATAEGRRPRAVLLAVQAMLSVALLVGAGLFARSLYEVQRASLGYEPSRVVVLTRQIPPGGFDDAQQAAIRRGLLDAAVASPDVASVAWMSSAPFVSTSSTDLHVPDVADVTRLGPFTFQATTAGYFTTMGTRILRGRGLAESDTAGAPPIAVVSESMARTLWSGRDPIGRCFRMRTVDAPCRTVVGIAEDIVQRDLVDGPRRHYYVPIEQYPRTYGNGLLIRLSPTGDAERVRLALQRQLPAGYYLVATALSDVVADQQASWRMGAVVLVAFAALALIVAGVGLHGSVRFDIAQRTREWAVRVALGAGRAAILRQIVRGSLWPVIAGVIPGVVVAAAAGRWLEPLLYRTSAGDPRLFGAAAATMVVVAIVASARPALTAASADPNVALRDE